MSEVLQIMVRPFLACLILTGIHAYFGLHVLVREIIFVDLALAQIAALGATFAFLLGYDLHSQAAYFAALAFSFVGAAIFALARPRERQVSQEAIIGIVYAVSAALAILVVDRA
ncbi:MAG: metal ABC transporter permease, partial [Candidatus Methylomirabilales bacterium]